MSASTELFAERGFAATTMRQLADRANLPLSAFYYYFPRKYDVLLAIMNAVMDRLDDGAANAYDETLDPDARLRALVDRHVRTHLLHPEEARVADGELQALLPADRDAMVARRDRYERRFRDVLADGVESRCFAKELDVPVAAMAILTMATGVIHWWRPEGRRSIDETARCMGAFASGIGRHPELGGPRGAPPASAELAS